MDGFFIAKFKKTSNDIPEKKAKAGRNDTVPEDEGIYGFWDNILIESLSVDEMDVDMEPGTTEDSGIDQESPEAEEEDEDGVEEDETLLELGDGGILTEDWTNSTVDEEVRFQ